MPQNREPLNSKYCEEVNCNLRSGNKCTLPACTRVGAEKRIYYFIEHGHLTDGDIPDK